MLGVNLIKGTVSSRRGVGFWHVCLCCTISARHWSLLRASPKIDAVFTKPLNNTLSLQFLTKCKKTSQGVRPDLPCVAVHQSVQLFFAANLSLPFGPSHSLTSFPAPLDTPAISFLAHLSQRPWSSWHGAYSPSVLDAGQLSAPVMLQVSTGQLCCGHVSGAQ